MHSPIPETGEPRIPTMKQLVFLSERVNNVKEVLFGGSAGGGKSDALLMAALQYVQADENDSDAMKRAVKGYRALILRRTYSDLSLPGALMDRAADWLAPTDAKWNATEKTWKFPSGATITFGFLERENDKYRYQGANFHCICFDEGTQFLENQYRYLFSRLRKGKGDPIPLRMRMGSNPGGVGHDWVRRRFVRGNKKTGRLFIPSRLDDNPHLDQESYKLALDELDPVTRRQLLAGDWDAVNRGNKFKREWFGPPVPGHTLPPYRELTVCRYWDFAATEPKPGIDPDHTAGVLYGFHKNTMQWYVLDVARFRGTPGEVKYRFGSVCEDDYLLFDGMCTAVIEQEPGASGKHMVDDLMTTFGKYDIQSFRPTGRKEVRANPVSSRAEAGKIRIVDGPWNNDFFDELEGFPFADHDDMVDALSGAHLFLSDELSPMMEVSTVRGMVTPVREIGDLRLVGNKYVDLD